jgi:hypothetical protein
VGGDGVTGNEAGGVVYDRTSGERGTVRCRGYWCMNGVGQWVGLADLFV